MSIMSSTLATSFLISNSPPLALPGHLSTGISSRSFFSVRVLTVPRAARPSSSSSSSKDKLYRKNRVAQTLKTLTKAVIFIGATFLVASSVRVKLKYSIASDNTVDWVTVEVLKQAFEPRSIESDPATVEIIKYVIQKLSLEGNFEEVLRILDWMTAVQPSAHEWNFLKARLLGALDRPEEARKVFEEILRKDPSSFEASFENALLMDNCGEGEVVIGRLQEALDLMVEKESRDARLMMAQMQFHHKNVEGALAIYEELANEDPSDFRPFFCRAIIYALLGRDEEMSKQFDKYYKITNKYHEVGVALRRRRRSR